MLNNIETPALVINERKMNRNMQRMTAVKEKYNVQVRPHFKTHKSVFIAHELMKAGATGMTTAKVSEAEVLLNSGVTDILIAHPLVEKEKILRLAPHMAVARIILTADSPEQADIINEAASEVSEIIEVWIKVNSGLNRCGVEPGEETVRLAEHVSGLSHLHLNGLYTHAGHSYGKKTKEEIDAVARYEAECIVTSASMCESSGIAIENRSIGSTPTFETGASIEGITEVRPGNAVFFDRMQIGLGTASRNEAALTVLTQVVSIKDNRIIFDGGSKAFTTEKGAHSQESVTGFGEAADYPDLILTRLSEEHGIADLSGDSSEEPVTPALGEKVSFIPNHACTAVNLFNNYVLVKENGDMVRLPVDGRGCSQ